MPRSVIARSLHVTDSNCQTKRRKDAPGSPDDLAPSRRLLIDKLSLTLADAPSVWHLPINQWQEVTNDAG